MSVRVIKKKEGRIDRDTGMVINRKLRVAAYARVSTGDEDQLNSYESQKRYYKEKINSSDEWEFVEIYADEAISGTQDYKRADFMRMIQDGTNKRIDMILTKSISRFARNTMDTLKYVRLLKEKNVAVIFEEENINTLEMSGELMLTILSSIAQQESENTSSHVKLGLKIKMERGELVGFNRCYGYNYDKETKKLSINEEEAEIVRLIFDKYCNGHGATYIGKFLTNMGVKSPRGIERWPERTVCTILKNEKYKGDILQGKTFTTDPITHKRMKNMGEENQYYVTDHHEAIVSREMFDKVQEIMKERRGARATGRRLGNIGRKYPFSGRLRCGFCGDIFIRRSHYASNNRKEPTWWCVKVIKGNKGECECSKIMREDVVKTAFVDTFSLLTSKKILGVDRFLEIIYKSMRSDVSRLSVHKLKNKKIDIENKLVKLVDLAVSGGVDNTTFNNQKKKYNDEIEKLEIKIEQLELVIEDDDKVEKGIAKLKSLIENKESIDDFDSDLFDALIDYIIVGGYDENGEKDSYMIRFICKQGFNFIPKENIIKEDIVLNNKICINETENYLPLLDFISSQRFFSFDKDEKGRLSKRVVNSVRVRLEIEK